MKYIIGALLIATYLFVHSYSKNTDQTLKEAKAVDATDLKVALSSSSISVVGITSASGMSSVPAGSLTKTMREVLTPTSADQSLAAQAEPGFNRILSMMNTEVAAPRDRLSQVSHAFDQMKSEGIQDGGLKLKGLQIALQVVADDPDSMVQVRSLALQELNRQSDQSMGRAPAAQSNMDQDRDVAISSYNLFLHTLPAQDAAIETTREAMRLHRDQFVQEQILLSFAQVYPQATDAFRSEPAYISLQLDSNK